MKTSRYYRYQDGYWLKSRYILHRYWFKFLRYAELDPRRVVDWSKYDGWGGPSAVLNERFELWWKTHWKDLFGVLNERDNARYEVSRRKVRADTIRISLLVYEHRHLADNWAIYDALNKRYRNLGSLETKFDHDDAGAVILERGKPKVSVLEAKQINRHMKRYRDYAEYLLDEVCEGRFG